MVGQLHDWRAHEEHAPVQIQLQRSITGWLDDGHPHAPHKLPLPPALPHRPHLTPWTVLLGPNCSPQGSITALDRLWVFMLLSMVAALETPSK